VADTLLGRAPSGGVTTPLNRIRDNADVLVQTAGWTAAKRSLGDDAAVESSAVEVKTEKE
jgi:hypothetical protein